MSKSLKHLQERLRVYFDHPALLKQAFTHSSYVNEKRSSHIENNERLEFLGDAVVELIVSEYLYNEHKRYSEGQLSKLRAAIVCEPSLMKLAETLQLGDYIMLGKGEEATGGRTRPALLADLFESFVAALYLDQGLDAVRDFFDQHIFPLLADGDFTSHDDYKSSLQQFVQQRGLGQLTYRVAEELGPSHDRLFVMEVLLDQVVMGQGEGRSKKEAEQQAASMALQKLKSNQG